LIHTLLLSTAVLASCVGTPSILLADDEHAQYEFWLIGLPTFERLSGDEPQAARLRAVAAEAAGEGNTIIEIGTSPSPPRDSLPVQEPLSALPSESPAGPVIRLPPVDLIESPHPPGGWLHEVACDVVNDYRNFYSLGSLAALGAGVGVGAVMANTPTDEKIRDFWQENVRCASTDEYFEAFHAPKILGDGYIMFPTYAGAALIGLWSEEGSFGHSVGDWGAGSLRAIGVGGPMMLALQYVTGGARPREELGSDWKPFEHTHGVSGHAFMGAVPFLTAAKMIQSPFWKTVLYTGSVLPGLSRINDDDHYASQVVMGWWIAYLAATAVNNTNTERQNFTVGVIPTANGVAFGLQWSH
jgi:hypothetical protein